MGQKSFNIKIENPCGQSWDEMKTEGNGKFCSHCTKVVVDFNSMTDSQIVNFLTKQSGSVCGRISKARAATDFFYPKKNISIFNFSLLRYSLAGILTFSSIKSFSQTKNKTENVLTDNSGKKKVITENKKTEHTNPLLVRVKNDKGKLLSTGTTIRVESGLWSFEVNSGSGKIQIPDSLMNASITLSVYAPGMESFYEVIEMKKNKLKPIDVTLQKETQMMMGVMMINPKEIEDGK